MSSTLCSLDVCFVVEDCVDVVFCGGSVLGLLSHIAIRPPRCHQQVADAMPRWNAGTNQKFVMAPTNPLEEPYSRLNCRRTKHRWLMADYLWSSMVAVSL